MLSKEKIVLVATMGLLAWLGTCHFQPAGGGRFTENKKGIDIPEVTVPRADRFGQGTGPAAGRDVFLQPRETSPLPPLDLALPPAPPKSLVAPPIEPGVDVVRWGHHYLVDAGGLAFEFAPQEDAAAAEETLGGGEEVTLSREEKAAAFKKLYDWFRPNPTTYLWGKILNNDRFDLGRNLREPLQFQEFDPKTGEKKGKPTSWEPDRVHDYGFAETIANLIEVRRRQISFTPGKMKEVIAFGDWCISKGGEDPLAFTAAEKVFQKAVDIAPGNPAGSLGMGRLLERSFRLEEAYDLYSSMAAGEYSHRPEPFLHLGKLQSRLRMFSLAEESLERAVEVGGSDWEPRVARAEFLVQQREYGKALETLEGIAEEPADRVDRARIRAGKGTAHLGLGQVGEASRFFSLAKEADPEFRPAHEGLVSSLHAQGDHAAALQAVDEALAAGLTSQILVTGRGILGTLMGDFEEAQRDLLNALSLDPLNQHRPLAALAFLYLYTGNVEQAIPRIEEAGQRNPTDPYVRYLKAYLMMLREDLDGARTEITAVLNQNFEFVPGLVLRARNAELSGEHQSAERYYSRACLLDEKNAGLFSHRALNLIKGGSVAGAELWFQKALNLDPSQPTGVNGLAFCAYKQGNVDQAISILVDIIDGDTKADEHRAYAEAAFASINDHLTKVLWTDEFQRRDVRRGWIEDARFGPEISLHEGVIRMEGPAREAGRTRFFREVGGKGFLEFSADLTSGAKNQSISGLHLVVEKKVGATQRVQLDLSLARLRDGRIAVRHQTSRVQPDWQAIPGRTWSRGESMRISLVRYGDKEPKLQLFLDGEKVLEPFRAPLLKTMAGNVRLGVFAEAETGRNVDCGFDNVQVVYREAKK